MSEHESAGHVAKLIALYRASHYDVELPGGRLETIRVGRDAPPAAARWIGARAPAFFMTACNPRSVTLSDAENADRLDRLRQQVRALGGEFLEGSGHMPGEDWREPSLLVAGIDEADIDALAREHEQNAVVVVPSRGAVRLRVYRSDWRWVACDVANVEWA